LTEELLGPHAPVLQGLCSRGHKSALRPVLPAVTCSVQASMVTGVEPSVHGIVGNGWFNRELNEVQFWKQSNALVHGEKVWETARRRDPTVTCATMFWWHNMYSSADYSVTPRPIYKADGRKLPDCYSAPAELRDRLQAELGAFPLFRFWGPAADITSTRWIAEASVRVHRWHDPTLMLVYLPHLDYALQKHGPHAAEARAAVAEVDAEVGRLHDYFESTGTRTIVVSEYGIEPVDSPVHINRTLREAGLVAVRVEDGLELMDAGASRAFAVADHQVAHVYVRDPADLPAVRDVCSALQGVESVLDGTDRAGAGLNHPRSGELILIAKPGAWFTYYYWTDDRRAPDFARCVDIHRKPGYDPCELLIDPGLRFPKLKIAGRLLQKKIGQRMLMDVIPLDATAVRGSHGRADMPSERSPLIISPLQPPQAGPLPCTAVRDVILQHMFEG
jgi:predicted AlkP superfamily pyrophosphatase or phosphodiesterase